jgi:transcriptional regulator of acetoin/glycerol metabolism
MLPKEARAKRDFMSSVRDTTTRLGERDNERERLGPLAISWLLPGAEEPLSILDRAELSLGRGEEADVRFEASGVSRLHARLHRQGPIFALQDLESTNGTFVNGARVQHQALSTNDVVRLGTMVGVVTRLAPGDRDAAQSRELGPGLLFGPGLSEVLGQLESVAHSDLPVVIWGETGVGKERLAQALHVMSGRGGNYHGINCAALPVALAEAELFGHRRGAYTGAEQAGLGHLRAAHEGTLMLDELADLPFAVQAKLLRVLQEQTVTPVGETRPLPVQVRVVAACQAPLSALVAEKRLRADLAARLSGLSVEIPPLRKRRIDVAFLFRHFLDRYSGGRPPELEAELLERLLIHHWPGNVRELELTTRRLVVVHSQEAVLRLAHLPAEFAPAIKGELNRQTVAVPRREHDERAFALALKQSGGKVAPAAVAASISRQRAYRLLAGRSVDEFLSTFAEEGEGMSDAPGSAR